jgi:uncharacterized membrane protein
VPVGNYPVSATYSGDATFAASSGSASLDLTAVPTTTALSATPNLVYVGQNLTLSATVTAPSGTPTGTVNFLYAGQTFASAPIVSGVATFTTSTASLPSGVYDVTASYPGEGSFAASTSGAAQVSVGSASTTTTLTSPNSTITSPANFTLVATVARSSGTGTPTGSVTFSYSGVALATVALNSAGVATYSRPTGGIPVGQYALTAKYNGDASDKVSTSSSLTVTLAGTVDVAVTVNPLANRHVISPLIYGTNFPPSTSYILNTNSTLARWAGDASSNYNWQTGITNLADDYFYANYPLKRSTTPPRAT